MVQVLKGGFVVLQCDQEKGIIVVNLTDIVLFHDVFVFADCVFIEMFIYWGWEQIYKIHLQILFFDFTRVFD